MVKNLLVALALVFASLVAVVGIDSTTPADAAGECEAPQICDIPPDDVDPHDWKRVAPCQDTAVRILAADYVPNPCPPEDPPAPDPEVKLGR